MPLRSPWACMYMRNSVSMYEILYSWCVHAYMCAVHSTDGDLVVCMHALCKCVRVFARDSMFSTYTHIHNLCVCIAGYPVYIILHTCTYTRQSTSVLASERQTCMHIHVP